jgi:hypothetical protein
MRDLGLEVSLFGDLVYCLASESTGDLDVPERLYWADSVASAWQGDYAPPSVFWASVGNANDREALHRITF